jgi:hypothetical protein
MYTGTLRFVDIETGSWLLVTSQGSYQLFFNHNRPSNLKDLIGKTVSVHGKVRSGHVTATMTGTPLEVESIQ